MCYYAVRDTAMEKNKIELDCGGKWQMLNDVTDSLQQNRTADLN